MYSQADISLETSLSFPHIRTSCQPSHFLSSSSQTLASPPSLYFTFKVFQLLDTFRKRVKTRTHTTHQSGQRRASKKITEDFCQGFERQAFEEIDRYLGRKTVYPQRKRAKTAVSTSQGNQGNKPRQSTLVVEEQASSRSIDWRLEQINQAVRSETHALSTVAANEKLFVQRKATLTLLQEHLSVKELTELLVNVTDLLKSLKRAVPSRVKTLCEGNELLDLTLDETYLANFEHLLLCLKDQLLRLLVAKLVEVVHNHLVECQRDQTKHCENWFFEFPDARHPLSTTWPWSIRPSLAVIWGVCWMFYDHNGSHLPPETPLFDDQMNMVNEQGEVIAERHAVAHFLSNLQRQQQGYYTANPSQAMFNPHRAAPAGDPSVPRTTVISQSPSSEEVAAMAAPHYSQAPSHLCGLNSRAISQPPSQQQLGESRIAVNAKIACRTTLALTLQAEATESGAHASLSLDTTNTAFSHNTYSAAPSSYAAPADANNWLPEDYPVTVADFQASAYAAAVDSWQHLPQQAVPDQQRSAFGYPEPLPPRAQRDHNPLTPTIRVTTDFSNVPDFHQQPQDSYLSATSVSSSSSFAHPDNAYYINPYYQHAQHLSPVMQTENPVMETPPHSPRHGAAGGEQFTRKRSYSEMSAGHPAHPHSGGSRSGSASGHAHSPVEEGYSPRRPTVKRPDPPMNSENKYYCDASEECQGQTFERKCEWSKHMDKHDRPYRCPHPSCAKLQGFTYSGGLLRHEREVHGKHGGPKAQLMCPHEDCKRHSGKGFTRKENLNEHIRRVHQSKDQQSQGVPLKRDADEIETPASEGAVETEESAAHPYKRRRTTGFSERSASEDVEDLKHELNRVLAESADKDSRIALLEQNMAQMQEALRQMQQHNQGQG